MTASRAPKTARASDRRKVLVTLLENDVAPRFDLATEVFITAAEPGALPARTVPPSSTRSNASLFD